MNSPILLKRLLTKKTPSLPPHITKKNTYTKKMHTEYQENTPLPKKPHMQQQSNNTRSNKKETNTYGTIIGHSPHPPTCAWVGWVFNLGLCRASLSLFVSSSVSFKVNTQSTSSTTSITPSNCPYHSNFSFAIWSTL